MPPSDAFPPGVAPMRSVVRQASAVAKAEDLLRQLRCLLILTDYFEWSQAQRLLAEIIGEMSHRRATEAAPKRTP